jgi:aconitate hydratase
VQSSLAGPKRPQDRVNLGNIPSNFKSELPCLSLKEVDINEKYVEGQDYLYLDTVM